MRYLEAPCAAQAARLSGTGLAAGIIAAVRAVRPIVAATEPSALPVFDAFLGATDAELARSAAAADPK